METKHHKELRRLTRVLEVASGQLFEFMKERGTAEQFAAVREVDAQIADLVEAFDPTLLVNVLARDTSK